MSTDAPVTGAADADREAQAVAAAIERHAQRPGALLPLLHEVQNRLGYLPPTCVAPIARALNLSRAEVHGVITFYHHFRREPPGRQIVRVCQAEACRSMGAERLLAHARERLGCEAHGRSGDGAFSLEPVYCLGQCANAPAVMVGERVLARMSPKRFDELIADDLAARCPSIATGQEQPDAHRDRTAIATVYVPRDSTALAVGAGEVAEAIAAQAAARGLAVRIVRNGSRGMF